MATIKGALKWFGAGAGAAVPAYSYFTSSVPPLFPEIGLITGALAGAIIFSVSTYKPTRDSRQTAIPRLVRAGLAFISLATILLIVYTILFRLCTIQAPGRDVRFQIGFGNFDWSLTEVGKNCVHQYDNSITDCMLSQTAFTDGGPERIWHPWSIYFAGILLIIVHLLGFTLWTLGFSVLAKQKSAATRRRASVSNGRATP